MAGWTWMSYSYAWEVSAEQLRAYEEQSERGLEGTRTYFRLHTAVIRYNYVGEQLYFSRMGEDVHLRGGSGQEVVLDVVLPLEPRPEPGTQVLLRGRLARTPYLIVNAARRTLPTSDWAFDTTASRFTGASVAGLVVGAMGCFIFGLYLRRWLIGRKALASQPGQDMIA
jgi:hypothetical protein